MSSTKRDVILGDPLKTTTQGIGNNGQLDLTHTAAPHPPHRDDILSDEWSLFINGDTAIASLQRWSAHTWPNAPEKFAEHDTQIFLPAARVMAVASALSYSNQEGAQRRLGSAFWNAHLIDEDNAQAMLYMSKKKYMNDAAVMIVAFRGTEQNIIQDWCRNLRLGAKSYFEEKKSALHGDKKNETHEDKTHEPQVHEGFLSGWRALKGLLKEQIETFYKEREKQIQLFVTGHSQGAALAGLSLLDLLLEQQQQQPQMYMVKGCLVLAAPKHGDKAYSLAVADAIARYEIPFDLLANQSNTGCDPVVCVPAAVGTLPPYVAPSGRLWIVQVGRKTTGPATKDEAEKVINVSWDEAWLRITTATPLHAIGSSVGYLSALRDEK